MCVCTLMCVCVYARVRARVCVLNFKFYSEMNVLNPFFEFGFFQLLTPLDLVSYLCVNFQAQLTQTWPLTESLLNT